MSARSQGRMLVAGIAGTLVLLVWPVRAHRAMWEVTVGSETTRTVPVAKGVRDHRGTWVSPPRDLRTDLAKAAAEFVGTLRHVHAA